MPLLLTAGGARGVFTGANEVCRDVLAELAPTMDVTYLELPGYAHSDVWLGRASALALFPSIVSWLERVVATEIRVR
jgi:cholesterol oxidase